MPTQTFTFPNRANIPLSAKLDLPTVNPPKAYILLAHCFTCSKEYKILTTISRALTEHHFAVLRFDFTGLGKSGGIFSQTNFSTMVADIVSASQYLQHHYQAPQVLLGHSLGGTASLQAAAEIPSAVAVVTVNSPASPTHVSHHFHTELATIQQHGRATVAIAGRPFTIRQQFLDDIQQMNLAPAIHHLNKALLIFHAPDDTVVSLVHAQQLFQQAQHPKSFIALDRADHLLSNSADAYFVGMLAAHWSQRYLR